MLYSNLKNEVSLGDRGLLWYNLVHDCPVFFFLRDLLFLQSCPLKMAEASTAAGLAEESLRFRCQEAVSVMSAEGWTEEAAAGAG